MGAARILCALLILFWKCFDNWESRVEKYDVEKINEITEH